MNVRESASNSGMVKRAASFFAQAARSVQKTHRAAVAAAAHLAGQNKILLRRTAELVGANRQLKKGILRRKFSEKALSDSRKRYAKLSRESQHLQKHLQRLAHQILLAQEDERTHVSHSLQEEIAQTLLGINVRLLTLKKQGVERCGHLTKEIASTQRMVKKSVETINRFACEYRKKY
jgi:hypothetical protein